jgi:hypothetical protein
MIISHFDNLFKDRLTCTRLPVAKPMCHTHVMSVRWYKSRLNCVRWAHFDWLAATGIITRRACAYYGRTLPISPVTDNHCSSQATRRKITKVFAMNAWVGEGLFSHFQRAASVAPHSPARRWQNVRLINFHSFVSFLSTIYSGLTGRHKSTEINFN